jgi:hypothetical protein
MGQVSDPVHEFGRQCLCWESNSDLKFTALNPKAFWLTPCGLAMDRTLGSRVRHRDSRSPWLAHTLPGPGAGRPCWRW